MWEIEKNLDTYKEQLTDSERDEIKNRIKDVRNAIDENDAEKIRNTSNDLQSFTSKLFADAYQKKVLQK